LVPWSALGACRHGALSIVGVVMVDGWPIAHHVWAGNELDHGTVQRTIRDLHQ
jgi:hypothetical protein